MDQLNQAIRERCRLAVVESEARRFGSCSSSISSRLFQPAQTNSSLFSHLALVVLFCFVFSSVHQFLMRECNEMLVGTYFFQTSLIVTEINICLNF